MVAGEMQQRLQDLAMRLAPRAWTSSSTSPPWTATPDHFVELRETAEQSARVDLALRAVADAEGIELTDDDLEAEFASIATQLEQDVEAVRHEFERPRGSGRYARTCRNARRSSGSLEQVEIVDADGNPVDRDDARVPDRGTGRERRGGGGLDRSPPPTTAEADESEPEKDTD